MPSGQLLIAGIRLKQMLEDLINVNFQFMKLVPMKLFICNLKEHLSV